MSSASFSFLREIQEKWEKQDHLESQVFLYVSDGLLGNFGLWVILGVGKLNMVVVFVVVVLSVSSSHQYASSCDSSHRATLEFLEKGVWQDPEEWL